MIDNLATVLITTSPSKKHPDTDLIETTLCSVRWHLPTAEVLILCDGVRKEQEHYRERYSEFILALEAIILDRYANVRLVVEPEWLHQAHLIRKGLQQVKTPLVLFTEHDQAFLPVELPWDEKLGAWTVKETIPWDILAEWITSGQGNLVRFMMEDKIKPEWEAFMLGSAQYAGLLKTIQWSQRTHLASTTYYRAMIEKHILPADRCYLEDRLYGQCDDWEENKLTIFYPSNPRRIYHLDGRGNEPKFDSVLEGKE